MSHPIYMVPAGDIIPIFFSTYSGTTGASITASGFSVTDIEVYKDGSTTQRASDNGYTLLDTDGIDFDGITGIHGFSIDTGDNSTAGFYTIGAWFTVVVSVITADAQTLSFIAAQFRIMAAESVAGKPKADVDVWNGTAVAVPSVAGVPKVDLTHVGGSTTNVSALATNIADILVDTSTTLDGAIAARATPAQVNAEVVDALNVDTYAEPGQGTPAGTVSLAAKIGYLYKSWRNKKTNDGTDTKLFADDSTTVDHKQSTGEAGGTVTKSKWTTGP